MKKGLRIKLKKKKSKILHSPSTIMCKMINSEALHSEKPTPFKVILNIVLERPLNHVYITCVTS